VADRSEANSCHFCSISSAVRFAGAPRNISEGKVMGHLRNM